MEVEKQEQQSQQEKAAGAATAATAATPNKIPRPPRYPVSCLVVGMAGSGKSTLVQRLVSYLRTPDAVKKYGGYAGYCMNLDPAVNQCPFANIDIRDTVKYKEVMKKFNLGPNGAIMTSLNLFTTKFDQVVGLLQRRPAKQPALKYVLVDTPGQIEAFTWSASGTIVTEYLATTMPTVILYVVDVPRSAANPSTFMANMLYACSILYRTQLPVVLVLTKTDVLSHEVITRWMTDREAFRTALAGDQSFAHDLTNSMSFMLEEFYSGLRTVGVSAVTGNGIPALFDSVDKAIDEFFDVFLADREKRKAEKDKRELARQKKEYEKFERDMTDGHGGVEVKVPMTRK